jgi:hypothetical protein
LSGRASAFVRTSGAFDVARRIRDPSDGDETRGLCDRPGRHAPRLVGLSSALASRAVTPRLGLCGRGVVLACEGQHRLGVGEGALGGEGCSLHRIHDLELLGQLGRHCRIKLLGHVDGGGAVDAISAETITKWMLCG